MEYEKKVFSINTGKKLPEVKIVKTQHRVTKEYIEYIQSAEWRNKRLEKAKEQNYTCEICGKKIKTGFEVHHRTYINLGNEPLCDLAFLCKNCHTKIHKEHNETKNKLKLKKYKKSCRHCAYCINKSIYGNKVIYCSLNDEVIMSSRSCKYWVLGAYKEADKIRPKIIKPRKTTNNRCKPTKSKKIKKYEKDIKDTKNMFVGW